MSLPTRSTPAVITVRPTHVGTGGPQPAPPPDDFHHRLKRPFTIAIYMALGTWIAHLIVSGFDSAAAFWVAIAGMCATGLILYRELRKAGAILNWIVGALIVLTTLPLPAIFTHTPLSIFGLSSSHFGAISLGLAISWFAHALSRINKGEPPCRTVL